MLAGFAEVLIPRRRQTGKQCRETGVQEQAACDTAGSFTRRMETRSDALYNKLYRWDFQVACHAPMCVEARHAPSLRLMWSSTDTRPGAEDCNDSFHRWCSVDILEINDEMGTRSKCRMAGRAEWYGNEMGLSSRRYMAIWLRMIRS